MEEVKKIYINNVPVYISMVEGNGDVKVVLYEPETNRSSVMYMKGSRTPIEQLNTIREFIISDISDKNIHVTWEKH